jgi:hypothetical protein
MAGSFKLYSPETQNLKKRKKKTYRRDGVGVCRTSTPLTTMLTL